jgi:hypothetical protein
MVSPGREVFPAEAVVLSRKNSAKGPISRILSCAVIPLGAALPRTLISDLPGGFGDCFEPPGRVGPMRSAAWLWRALPSLFGLAPCGVYPASVVTAGAVRSYRTISPLPRRWSFRNGERTRRGGPTRVLRFQGGPPERGVAEAVSFLWHWPSMGFEAHVPDVIRHTALRSSDFPPPVALACAKASGSDRPVLLPASSVPRMRSLRDPLRLIHVRCSPGVSDEVQIVSSG